MNATLDAMAQRLADADRRCVAALHQLVDGDRSPLAWDLAREALAARDEAAEDVGRAVLAAEEAIRALVRS